MSLLAQNLDANRKNGNLRKDLEDLGSAAPGQDDSQPEQVELTPVQTGVPAGVNPDAAQGLPQYKKGTKSVPKTGAAIVHQGEAIIPAKDNPFKDNSSLHNPSHPNHAIFKNARPSAKHEYLMAVDPDYARGTSQQQAGYRKHLMGNTKEPGFGKISLPEEKPGLGTAYKPAPLSKLTYRVMQSLGINEETKRKLEQSGLSDVEVQVLLARLTKKELQALSA
jgi:hypothetical protein